MGIRFNVNPRDDMVSITVPWGAINVRATFLTKDNAKEWGKLLFDAAQAIGCKMAHPDYDVLSAISDVGDGFVEAFQRWEAPLGPRAAPAPGPVSQAQANAGV